MRWKPAHQYNDYPDCPTCNGAGYLTFARPVKDPLFGKVQSCPTCWSGGDRTAHEIGRT